MRFLVVLIGLAAFAPTWLKADIPPTVPDALAGQSPSADTADRPPAAEPVVTVHGDLLARVATQFRLDVPESKWVDQELAWFERHPDYLDRVFNRGEPYLYFIVGELEKRGMPVELALLPIVESAFDPFAYSHGRAAGLWQFIPGTGRRFGLKQNWWYDGRRDVIAATGAALDYLELLAGQFDGDWLLAIAAYNSGEGHVRKAVRRNRSRNAAVDFFSLRTQLPRETRSYVPRFLALATLVGNPAEHGLTLPIISDTPVIGTAATGGQIDLALAADLAGVPLEDLHRLNPGFNRWATAPKGPHRLVLPVNALGTFEDALAEVPENQRVRWLVHKVRSGETLSEIAEQHATSVASLKSTNQLRGSTIRVGQTLLVPTASAPLATYTLTAEAREEATRSRQRSGTRQVHVVRRGESFWTIARHYGVGVKALARWNAMAPRDTLTVGKELVVWTDKPAPAATTTSAAPPPPKLGLGETRRIRYTVRNGDNLSVIAARFRVRVNDLLRWNDALSRDAILRPGQRLTLYVDVAQQSS